MAVRRTVDQLRCKKDGSSVEAGRCLLSMEDRSGAFPAAEDGQGPYSRPRAFTSR